MNIDSNEPPELKIDPKTVRIPKPELFITKEIVERACQKDSGHCMIAEALREAVPQAIHISVDLQSIRFSDPRVGLRYTYLTPPIAQRALLKFDMGAKMDPFRFKLRGGHAASMFTGKGKKQQRKLHHLGKRRIVTVEESRERSGIAVESIGGKTPPRLSPKHASHHTVRIYGLRAFTGDILGPK